MSRTKIGDACAYLGRDPRTEKGRYLKIGIAFEDEQGRLSLKIDALPLPGIPWEGWINIFPDTKGKVPAPQRQEDDLPWGDK